MRLVVGLLLLWACHAHAAVIAGGESGVFASAQAVTCTAVGSPTSSTNTICLPANTEAMWIDVGPVTFGASANAASFVLRHVVGANSNTVQTENGTFPSLTPSTTVGASVRLDHPIGCYNIAINCTPVSGANAVTASVTFVLHTAGH